MKLLIATLACCLFGVVVATRLHADAAIKGVVTHRISGCDYFLVYTRNGYDLLEWYGGSDPDKGDILIGGYESYGFHDVYDDTLDESVRVWTEDYALSKTEDLEQLTDKCE